MTRLRRRILLTFLTIFSNRSVLHPDPEGTQLLTRLLHLMFSTKDLNRLGLGRSLSLRESLEVFVVTLFDVAGSSASPPLH
jgi:hypothetical protein